MSEAAMANAAIDFEKGTVGSTHDFYHKFDRAGGTERIIVGFNSNGVLVDATIDAEGSINSEYSVYGVHVGDSKETAESILSALYGFDSTSKLDDGKICTLTYNDEKMGLTNAVIDKSSNKVTGISVLKVK